MIRDGSGRKHRAPRSPLAPPVLKWPTALAAGALWVSSVALGQTNANAVTPSPASYQTEVMEELLAAPRFRNIGPFRQGSWITAIAAPEVAPAEYHSKHRHTIYIGARNGGVWKTTNNGTTVRNVTDQTGRFGVSSVGALAVSQSHPDTVWVGAGDAEIARSSYSGGGVWRSLDGGESWEQRGLSDSHHVARIVIHPTDPSQVWVASMGHLFSENTERGVFYTRDSGYSWEHVLDLGPEVGVIDLVIDFENPTRLWASAYDKVRLPWHFEAGGERSGIYRTDDSGRTWTKLREGLPQGPLGRIGIDRFRNSGPNRLAPTSRGADVLYAIVENLNPREPTEAERKADEQFTKRTGKEAEPRVVGNQVYLTEDGGDHWQLVSPAGQAIGSKSAYAFNEIRVDPWNAEVIYILSETLISSVDGGRTYRDAQWPMKTLFSNIFGDVRSMWINPHDPEHILLGSDGGVFPSYDGGKTSGHWLNLPLSEAYDVAVDDGDPYRVYAGLQDHEAWAAPINSWSGSVGVEDWVMVGRWDGMVSAISPDNRWYYATTQFGGHLRLDLLSGRRSDILPVAPESSPRYRFTWTTPLEISPHDPDVIWTGSQKLLRSSDRGDTWQERSPDLTDATPQKIQGKGHIRYHTITTHAESHLANGTIWVGTDDGRVWLTRNNGEDWVERTDALTAAGIPRDRWVSRVVPSRHSADRAYVSKSGYRRDDFEPYLARTDDFGSSWRDLTGRSGPHPLPAAPISVVLEDPANDNLLFVGNDVGVYATLDGGQHWFELGHRLSPPPDQDEDSSKRLALPRVPVRDLALQEREADLVVGTYGRGAWVADVRFLQEANADVLEAGSHLFSVEPKPLNFTERDEWGAHELYGDAVVRVPNETDGLSIPFWLGSDSAIELRVIRTSDDVELGRYRSQVERGFHRVRFPFPAPALSAAEDGGEPASEEQNGQDFPEPTPGAVEVLLKVGEHIHSRLSTLLEQPDQPIH